MLKIIFYRDYCLTEHPATYPIIFYETLIDAGIDIDDEVMKDYKLYRSFGREPRLLLYLFASVSGLDVIYLKKKMAQDRQYKKCRLYLPASHSLIEKDDRKLLSACLKLGLDANSLDKSGHTASWRAKCQEKKDLLELLASHGGV